MQYFWAPGEKAIVFIITILAQKLEDYLEDFALLYVKKSLLMITFLFIFCK